MVYPESGAGERPWAPALPSPGDGSLLPGAAPTVTATRGGRLLRGVAYAVPISLLLWAVLALTIWVAWVA